MHLTSVHPIFKNFIFFFNFLQQQNRENNEKQFPAYFCWAALVSLPLCCDKSVFWCPPRDRESSNSSWIFEVIKKMSQQDAGECEGKTAQICWQLWHSRSLFSISWAAPSTRWKLGFEIVPGRCCLSFPYSLMDIWEYSRFFCRSEAVQGLVWVYISVKVRAKCDPGILLAPFETPGGSSINVTNNPHWTTHKLLGISSIYIYSKYFQEIFTC